MQRLLIAALLLFASFAHTDPAQARRRHLAAAEAYEQGDLISAMSAWQEAYQEEPDPSYLYNLAQCYRRLGDPLQAITLLERYLSESKTPKSEVNDAILWLKNTTPMQRLEEPILDKPQATQDLARTRWWFWTSMGALSLIAAGGIAAAALSGPGVPNTALGHQDAFR